MEADGFVEEWLRPWRVGHDDPSTIWAGDSHPATATKDMVPFGKMRSSELAQRAVEDHNASLEGDETPSSYRPNM